MKNIIYFIFIWIPFVCSAQTYRYISTADGLSNQKIYRIQKDRQGYMWFLTHQGIDRYNGKEIKHYRLTDPYTRFDPQTSQDWIYIDRNGSLWVIGKKGRIFQYDSTYDRFNMVYKLSEKQRKKPSPDIEYGYLDHQDRIWLCNKDSITLYDIRTKQTSSILCKKHDHQTITTVEQTDSTHFFIGTNKGLFHTELKGRILRHVPCATIDSISIPINELYFHPSSRKLFIGTFRKGIIIHDMIHHEKLYSDSSLNDVNVTCITNLDKQNVLVATDGQGVYRIHTDSCHLIPYITANYQSHNEMNGNNINDIYVDDKQRIWLSNYPNGITIRDNRYAHYKWIKHSIGNLQSLINDQVYSIIEDHDGDLWFATSNGISLYRSQTGTWHSFTSSFQHKQGNRNHIFLALCEVSPGIIWASGYASGIYQINKENLSTEYFSLSSFFGQNVQPDQYIRAIKKDSTGHIWSGGYYNLKRMDLKNKKLRLYTELSSITCIIEKDKDYMWIGTTRGLYLLNKKSGDYQFMNLPVESMYISALCQTGENLYIGTSGSGLLIYNITDHTYIHYHTENCALISNNIYVIVPKPDGNILLATENEIVNFFPQNSRFHNWTKEQGLISATFNAGAGILRKNNQIILGSNNGAIEFPANMQLPSPQVSRPLILSDFRVSYQTVFPGDENSPLKMDINQTKTLRLEYDQNNFSLKVSSINYDYPSNILYLWKLEGFYNEWDRLSSDGRIHFTKLTPGKYTLHIRSVSNEEKYKTYEERKIRIIIEPPLWRSTWAIVLYLILLALATIIIYRIITLRRQKNISDEKTRFFINTAHDIRTPLTMIKAPLQEITEKKQADADGMKNINISLKNIDTLLHLTTNLINFEKVDTDSSELYIAEYELNSYVTELYHSFLEYACLKNVHFNYNVEFSYLNVWFDKEKMDSILQNIVSNALKYTPEGGNVHIVAYENKNTWNIEIKDTGIGVPACEQKKLFKSYFRGSNAVNMKVTGSGIGLMLTYKLVKLHHGKITLNSTEGKGTCLKISFPKGKQHFKKAHLLLPDQKEVSIQTPRNIISFFQKENNSNEQENEAAKKKQPRILVVEDNDDLRIFLKNILSETYRVESCNNGKEALVIVREFNPALILSDMMMPEMGGDELCISIKENIETSHIPIILLTALGDEKSMLKGLQAGADDYIAKPFSVELLKASISNLLANRNLLRNKYSNLEMMEIELPLTNGNLSSKEWEFIAAVKKNIEKNIANANFNVDTLCAMHNMSRSSFFNKLKALTGKSPSEQIRFIRLQRASRLLQEGYTPVEVADMCGFCDAKYFREVFKKHSNENPSDHRKKAGEKRKQ